MSFSKMVKCINNGSKNIKILVMGLDNAGKTSVLSKYLNLDMIVAPTFGYKIYNKNTENYNMSILDIGGQSSFKRFWSNYFEKADGVVFIVDCSDHRSFTDYLDELLKLEIPTAVLFNKTDLNTSFDLENGILDSFNEYKNVKCFKTSAVKGFGINEGFDWIVKSVLL